MYHSRGLTCDEIAVEYETTQQTVYRTLKSKGVAFRRRGTRHETQKGEIMGQLERSNKSGVVNKPKHSDSVSGTAGRGMVVAGVGVLAIPFAAALIPFMGTLAVAVAFILIGLFIAD